MQRVAVTGTLGGADPAAVFGALGDFESYPALTEAVREVRVMRDASGSAGGSATSEWSVSFRNGIMQWTERDTIDAQGRSIAFEQLDGDFEHFSGTWRVLQSANAVTVAFDAVFDMGMPSLEAIIDPIAKSALEDNVRAILRGVLGEAVAFHATT